MGFALVTTTVLLITSKFDDRVLFVFILYVVLLFCLDMTVNGLRYGFSFVFAMLAMSKFYQHHLLFSVVLGVLPFYFM